MNDFDQKLNESKRIEEWQLGHIQLYWPDRWETLRNGQRFRRATTQEDLAGTDYIMSSGERIDLKHRVATERYARFVDKQDPDLAIEHEGWAQKAGCDWYLFTFPPTIGLCVAYLVNAIRLRDSLPQLLNDYAHTIRTVPSLYKGSKSTMPCMFVPGSKVLEAVGPDGGQLWAYDERSVEAGTPFYPELPKHFRLPGWATVEEREADGPAKVVRQGKRVCRPKYDR